MNRQSGLFTVGGAVRLLALVCALLHLSSLPASAADTFASRVEGLLRDSGYDYKKVQDNSWYINKTGKHLTHIRVLLGAGSNQISVGAVVVSKKDLRVTVESMYKMMQLSYDLNHVRICVDPDKDLLVMSQVKGKWLDLQEFKDTIDRVATAADRAYGEVRPFVSTQ